jgi:hypothetical protein
MYVFISKQTKKSFSSHSKYEIQKVSGVNYHTLKYYFGKGLHENDIGIFANSKFIKSKQGSKSKIK